MRITIECHGATRRWCGSETLHMETPADATVGDALQWLAERYPEFAERRATVAVAIGDEIVRATTPLPDGARLALIPPVSGG